MFTYVSEDSTYFLLPWMQEFRNHGASALGGEFSNYNFPYLLLMFLSSLLPLEPLFAVKIVSLAGDCLLAFAVAAVAREVRLPGIAPATAGVISLFLPTVLLNASMWRQCDSIYTSFLLLSLRSLVRNDGRGAWLWWSVALAFKLQAVFFVPALAMIALRNRHSFVSPVMAACTWVLLSVPPVLFGRSLNSTFSIYINQTQEYRLVAGAANLYAWFPSATAEHGKIPAIVLCASALIAVAVSYFRGPDSTERRTLLAVTVVAVCPLLLPQMHDRYFFAAEVMSLLLFSRKRLFFVPWLLAATGLAVYILYFQRNQLAWPLIVASIIQCIAVGTLLRSLWRRENVASSARPSQSVRN